MRIMHDEPEVPPVLRRFLDRLDQDSLTHQGGLQFKACCPAHDDDMPSLSIGWSDKGKVLAKCHADCDFADILAALNLTRKDIETPRHIVATYDYENEDGHLQYQVVRYDPKDFKQRRPGKRKGQWEWSVKGVTPIPFHLPALAEMVEHGTAEDTIWIVEGEKDVQAIEEAYGDVATCNHGGANEWTDEHSAFLEGFAGAVVIVVDADEKPTKPGQKHALAVHESLLRVTGIDAELVYPAVGKDAADHVGDHDPDEFIAVTPDDLRAEIENARREDPDGAAARDERIEEAAEHMRIQREARARLAAEFAKASFSGFASVSLRDALATPREVKPAIVRGLQMQGHKATLTAQFKAGKTTLAGNLVRSLADGEPFMDRFEVVELPGNIGIFDYELTEDDALDMYGALGLRNTRRVFLESLRGEGFSLANEFHREQAVRWLTEHEIVYWVIDPFGRALRGFGSENANDDVRVFLDVVDEIVERTSVLGTLMPVHTGRAQHEVGAEHGRGATVVDDDADARWLLTRDSTGRRFFRAEGRNGVGAEEVSLEFDAATSRLSTGTVTREESKGERHLSVVENYLFDNPGAGVNDMREAKLCGNTELSAALKLGIRAGTIRKETEGKKHLHYYVPPTVIHLVQEGE